MITARAMLLVVEDEVCWQRGVGSEWECDAIISADLLKTLVTLAAKAPLHEKKKLFKELNDD